LHETPQVAILQRPQDQMPVIRHEAKAQNAYKDFGLSFCQDFFERGIVSVIVENPIPGISTVEYVNLPPFLPPAVEHELHVFTVPDMLLSWRSIKISVDGHFPFRDLTRCLSSWHKLDNTAMSCCPSSSAVGEINSNNS
jgi:hypothetical protein